MTLLEITDPSGNPVTEQVQSVVVTDASGNPVTGTTHLEIIQSKYDFNWSKFAINKTIYFLDSSGNPVTEKVAITVATTLAAVTVGVTDASGNPVTGLKFLVLS